MGAGAGKTGDVAGGATATTGGAIACESAAIFLSISVENGLDEADIGGVASEVVAGPDPVRVLALGASDCGLEHAMSKVKVLNPTPKVKAMRPKSGCQRERCEETSKGRMMNTLLSETKPCCH